VFALLRALDPMLSKYEDFNINLSARPLEPRVGRSFTHCLTQGSSCQDTR
jgi:hypothetical protein